VAKSVRIRSEESFHGIRVPRLHTEANKTEQFFFSDTRELRGHAKKQLERGPELFYSYCVVARVEDSCVFKMNVTSVSVLLVVLASF